LGEVLYELTKVQFAAFSRPETWRPAINAYRCEECIAVCVELAGLSKEEIDVRVEPRRVLVRGQRLPPDPAESKAKPVHILAMEIDYGPFEREVLLPVDVDPEQVTAEQRNGLLWIYLPFRPHA
jgi:HSP20 family protein